MVLTLVSALWLAAAPAKDAGVADAGKVAVTAADAGVREAAPAPREPSSEVASTAPRGEVERLRKELAELKERTIRLERQAAQSEAVASQLEKINRQLTDLREDMADAEQRRADTERRAVERRAQVDATTSMLVAAQQTLATGSNNVNDALKAAEATFTGAALRDIQAARIALANGDLAAARQYVAAAIIDAQAGTR